MRSILLLSVFSSFVFATIINIPLDYITIQEGIDNSVDGDTVLVQPGEYSGGISFLGKNITVSSIYLLTSDYDDLVATIIQGEVNGPGSGSVVIFNNGESVNSILCGFIITQGTATEGGGIHCTNSNPTLRSLLIYGNTGACGAGVFCNNANVTFQNVSIVNNFSECGLMSDCGGGGVWAWQSTLTFVNCTISDNNISGSNNPSGHALWIGEGTAYIDNCIFWHRPWGEIIAGWLGEYESNFSWIEGETPDATDPMFIDPTNNDYRLDILSPCIDIGNPDLDGDGLTWEDDPDDQDPDGTRMDMGAYYLDQRFIGCPNELACNYNPGALFDDGSCYFHACNGVIAVFPFAGNIEDASENENNGINFGTIATTDRFGNPESAILLNGSGEYIEIPHQPELAPENEISISLWFSRDSWNDYFSDTRLISKTQTGGYNIGINDNGEDAEGLLSFLVYIQDDYSVTSVPLVSLLSDWNHIVGTYDGRIVKMFLNGELASQYDVGGWYPIQYTFENSILIGVEAEDGQFPNELNDTFNGKIDDLRIYNRALTEYEVLTLYCLDGWCGDEVNGCTDPLAINFDPGAIFDDGSCIYVDDLDLHFLPAWSSYPLTPMGIYIQSAAISDSNLRVGDEIGIFDGTLCVGAIQLASEIDGVIQVFASADNPDSPELNGFIEGNEILFRFWDVSEQLEYINVIPDYITGQNLFTPLGFSQVALMAETVWGCTDPYAVNFSPDATVDDGNCIDPIFGCTDSLSCNYNPAANTDDESCLYLDCAEDCGGEAYFNECGCVGGTTNLEEFWCYGCTDPWAINYDPEALIDNDCEYPGMGDLTNDGILDVVDLVWLIDLALNDEFTPFVDFNEDNYINIIDVVILVDIILNPWALGCTDPEAANYSPDATYDDGSCEYDSFEWVSVPAGEFTFGQFAEIHTIDCDYQIMKYEVTNLEYAEFLQTRWDGGDLTVGECAISAQHTSCIRGWYDGDEMWEPGEYVYYAPLGEIYDYNIGIISFDGSLFTVQEGFGDFPVVWVTWFGAWAFAEHYGLNLPTEEEWEKAARGNTGYNFPWGDETPNCDFGAMNGASFNSCYNGVLPVGSFQNAISPFSTFDQVGNVFEWTNSFEHSTSIYTIVRGGAWYHDADLQRSWFRISHDTEGGGHWVGFRCMKQQ